MFVRSDIKFYGFYLKKTLYFRPPNHVTQLNKSKSAKISFQENLQVIEALDVLLLFNIYK
jgi:hypothetical protein